jgi:ABC-type cobalamin/Fe3+-siderophores transport system ATPase subunit
MSELLRLTDVSKRYKRGSQELQVLRDVSFEMDAGEVVGVIGVRGQGKTTLLRIAAGMESADAGTVCFAGRGLATLADRELSRLLGGEIAWAGRTGPGMRVRLLDYVAMPLLVGPASEKAGDRRGRRAGRRTVYTRAREALERVGAQGCAEAHWEDISDWERALVEIAQAIAGNPSLLLVDDLTDTLGIRETDELTALLRSLSRDPGMAVLMSASDAQATLWSDRIMILAGGRLTQGPESAAGNVIEFPDPGARRDVQRGGVS